MKKQKTICPVCGKWEFEFEGEYDDCKVCGWFDDPIQNVDHDYEGGCNRMSVNQYRKAWEAGEVGPYDESGIDDNED